jgi:hypothetical protein
MKDPMDAVRWCVNEFNQVDVRMMASIFVDSGMALHGRQVRARTFAAICGYMSCLNSMTFSTSC